MNTPKNFRAETAMVTLLDAAANRLLRDRIVSLKDETIVAMADTFARMLVRNVEDVQVAVDFAIGSTTPLTGAALDPALDEVVERALYEAAALVDEQIAALTA